MTRKLDLMNSVARSMADETGADVEDEKSKRKQVSKRSFITEDGDEAERMEEAQGARYTLLGTKDGETHFDEIFDNAKSMRMFAIFGFHTKIGNVANTVLNDKNDPGTPDDAAEAIQAFIDDVNAGTWADRTGGVGARIDKDALAGAVVDAYAAATPPKVVDYAKVRELLEDPANVKKFRQIPEVQKAYNVRLGKAPKTLDDLESLVA